MAAGIVKSIWVPADAIEAWEDVASREPSMAKFLVRCVRDAAEDYGNATPALLALRLHRLADQVDQLA